MKNTITLNFKSQPETYSSSTTEIVVNKGVIEMAKPNLKLETLLTGNHF